MTERRRERKADGSGENGNDRLSLHPSRPFGASLLMPEERPPPKRQVAADRLSTGLLRLLNHGSVVTPFALSRTDALPPHRKCRAPACRPPRLNHYRGA